MGADRLTPTIRAARLARGLTQAQLADAVGMGMTQGDVSYLERGAHWPSGLRRALAIAHALDTTVEALWPPTTGAERPQRVSKLQPLRAGSRKRERATASPKNQGRANSRRKQKP